MKTALFALALVCVSCAPIPQRTAAQQESDTVQLAGRIIRQQGYVCQQATQMTIIRDMGRVTVWRVDCGPDVAYRWVVGLGRPSISLCGQGGVVCQ